MYETCDWLPSSLYYLYYQENNNPFLKIDFFTPNLTPFRLNHKKKEFLK